MGGKQTGSLRILSSIAGIGLREHRCERFFSEPSSRSRLLQGLDGLGGENLAT